MSKIRHRVAFWLNRFKSYTQLTPGDICGPACVLLAPTQTFLQQNRFQDKILQYILSIQIVIKLKGRISIYNYLFYFLPAKAMNTHIPYFNFF